jgi:hypothetical protein
VIVSDVPTYLEAIAAWSDVRIFPVLIDDGTAEAREDIARFARAFGPSRVVRAGPAPSQDALKAFSAGEAVQIMSALERSWDPLTTTDGSGNSASRLAARWHEVSHTPMGVVLATANDPAWAGGLALAAGHGQILSFVGSGQGVNFSMQVKHADGLDGFARDAARASGLTWDALGDDLDAVTLAMNVPARLSADDKDYFALTDRVGRTGEGLGAGARWAWCGQLFGSAPKSVYRAMCSLFVTPERAWIFDSYASGAPWNLFDGTEASKVAQRDGWPAKLGVTLLDAPQNTAAAWREAAASPLDAGLVLVNTMGNWDFFDLQAGRRVPGDVPVQKVPSMVHMVHSWSARNPADRSTVGGRWLDQGAYAYVGSVHEPLLQAFVPTPMLMGRLLAGAPLGAAARHEVGPVWKVTMLGDPLALVSTRRPRDDDAKLEIKGGMSEAIETFDVAKDLRELLKAEKFDEAFEVLILQGRDADVAKLASALLAKDAPEPARALRVGFARAVLPLLREGKTAEAMRAFALAEPTARKELPTLDGVWLAAAAATPLPENVLDALRTSLRDDSYTRDALVLASAWSRVRGEASARAMLRSLASAAPQAQRGPLDAAGSADAASWAR